MTQTTAKIRKGHNHFEVLVDMDAALKVKKGVGNIMEALEIDKIFEDIKKGNVASTDEVEVAFGTSDVYKVAEEIIKHGEILIDEQHRGAEHEQRLKQVIDFLVRNSIDPQSGYPHTPERIKSVLEQAHVNIKNVPVEQQINDILGHISALIPIKIETKKVKIIIPAIYTGKAYGVINQYKESEDWKNDGSLEVVVAVPAGIIMDFYDKLNGVTHGAAITEEVRE
jgi:ribosome maturation protein SDO1